MSDIEVKDGMLFESTELSRCPGERFTVGQSPDYAIPFVRRWLAIGTVRPVEQTSEPLEVVLARLALEVDTRMLPPAKWKALRDAAEAVLAKNGAAP